MEIPLVDLKLQYRNLKKKIDKILLKVAASGYYIKGPNLFEFEQKFAKFIGTKYCVGVASGTDALKLSLTALDIREGDEVILPANTFIATAYAVLATNAKPIFVDADKNSLSIDPNLIERAITKRTKAIIPVHLFGFPAAMNKINKIAKKHNLYVIEDSAQAHGSFFGKKKAGNLGTISAFSFYPAKNLGAFGDAGAITTNSRKMYKRIIRLREYGGSKYYYSEIGTNSRLDEIQAALLSVKLNYLNRWNVKRRKIADYYIRSLRKWAPQVTPVIPNKNTTPVYHLFVAKCPKRNALASYLESLGIQTGLHYPVPLHLQKSLTFLGYKKGDFPVIENATNEILSLPMFPELTKLNQDKIVNSIRKFYQKAHEEN